MYANLAVKPGNGSLEQVLSEAEVQNALAEALRKLPQVMHSFQEIESMLSFAKNFAEDQGSLRYVFDGLQADLPELRFNRETLGALFALLDKLPKLVEMINTIEPMMEFLQAVLNDKATLNNLVQGAEELIGPMTQRIQDGAGLLSQATARAAENQSPIGVFGLMKMLKDPNVQYGLRVVQEFLAAMPQRQA